MELDPETLLSAYSQGAFPMTDHDGVTRWYTADPRGIIPLDQFHVPKTLGQVYRQRRFDIRINFDFEQTMRGCMTGHDGSTWISEDLIKAYKHLNALGFAHSVEAWQNGQLAGGLYGVSLGGAFFGESMFHRVRDASKVALVALVERLKAQGFELLDSQANTEHLARFGCVEIPAREYMKKLQKAIQKKCVFV